MIASVAVAPRVIEQFVVCLHLDAWAGSRPGRDRFNAGAANIRRALPARPNRGARQELFGFVADQGNILALRRLR
jgi:hypothetical protein